MTYKSGPTVFEMQVSLTQDGVGYQKQNCFPAIGVQPPAG